MKQVLVLLLLWHVAAVALRAQDPKAHSKYELTVSSNQFGDGFELVTVDISGENAARWPNTKGYKCPRWLPTGKGLVFQRGKTIGIIDADSGMRRWVLDGRTSPSLPDVSAKNEIVFRGADRKGMSTRFIAPRSTGQVCAISPRISFQTATPAGLPTETRLLSFQSETVGCKSTS